MPSAWYLYIYKEAANANVVAILRENIRFALKNMDVRFHHVQAARAELNKAKEAYDTWQTSAVAAALISADLEKYKKKDRAHIRAVNEAHDIFNKANKALEQAEALFKDCVEDTAKRREAADVKAKPRFEQQREAQADDDEGAYIPTANELFAEAAGLIGACGQDVHEAQYNE